jgi:hypothetical protein
MQNAESIEARYANYFQIGQNSIEFVIEFGQLYSDETAPLLHTRIITSRVYARNLLKLIREALGEPEAPLESLRDP